MHEVPKLQMAPMRIISQRPRVATCFFATVVALSITRVLVLFCESYSIVRAERQADIDLIQLCSTGAAKDSEKFRAACLQARSEQAAPAVLKAILKSIRTAFNDFAESFNSPSRIVVLLLFCLSGLALPVVKTFTNLVNAYMGTDALSRLHGLHFSEEDNPDDQESCRIVVMNTERRGLAGAVAHRLRVMPSRRGRSKLPSIVDHEVDDSNYQLISLEDKLK